MKKYVPKKDTEGKIVPNTFELVDATLLDVINPLTALDNESALYKAGLYTLVGFVIAR